MLRNLLFSVSLGLTSVVSMSGAVAGERIVVEGSRIPGGGGSTIGVGGGGRGERGSKPSDMCDERQGCEGGGSSSLIPLTGEMTNDKLAQLAVQQLGQLITTLSSKNAWAYLKVTVTTPGNLKVEVELELGYGQVNVKSKRPVR